jgi:hypothetical protein
MVGGGEHIVHHSSAVRTAGLFAALGVVSGLASAFCPIIDTLNISLGWTGLFSKADSAPLLPAIFFGLVLSILIYAAAAANVIRAASGVVTSVVAWVIAAHVAQEFRELWSGGLVAGAVGATLTAAGVALAVPAYRSLASMAVTIAAGTVTGLLLAVSHKDSTALSFVSVYVGWQASVAATIAYGIAKRRTSEPHTILTPAAG